MNRPLVLAMTGASGAPYAIRLLECLLQAGRTVHVAISPAACQVIAQELDQLVDSSSDLSALLPHRSDLPGEAVFHDYRDYMAPMASGSFLTGGMVICPCSGTTLSAIAHAGGSNLIQRAADVHLKERRKLILVPRETPLSLVHLDNMRKVTEAGAIVLPAMPGFYHRPRSMDDLVDFVVARILDQLEIGHDLMRRWGEE